MALIALLLVVLLAGCASSIPEPIRSAPPDSPSIATVRAAPERNEGTAVRWGGIIATVRNRAEDTLVEVIGYRLTSSGRPVVDHPAGGRFMASFPGFLEPTAYEEGRPLTVVGTVSGVIQEKIDDYLYTYPVVAVEAHHLWQPTARYDTLPPHTLDPWWPYYYGSPYYRPYPYGWRNPYYW